MFYYRSAADSPLGANDVITDFETGVDRIDVSGLGAGAAVALNYTVTIAYTADWTTIYYQAGQGPEAGVLGAVAVRGMVQGADIISQPGSVFYIAGTAAPDWIWGSYGSDRITGGGGADHLRGGVGADTFVYGDVGDSPWSDPDQILDFTVGEDKIDLTFLRAYANARVGISSDANASYVSVDRDGDGFSEMVINVTRDQPLTRSDLVM